MKPTPANRKLQLNKQAVSNLSREQMYVIVAGKEQERLTTSIFGCPVGSCATCCAAEVAVTSPASLSTIVQTTTLLLADAGYSLVPRIISFTSSKPTLV